jgi:hypothetical protein
MGVASPVFMNVIDTAGVRIATTVNHTQSVNMNFEASRSLLHDHNAPATTMTTAAVSTKGAQ